VRGSWRHRPLLRIGSLDDSMAGIRSEIVFERWAGGKSWDSRAVKISPHHERDRGSNYLTAVGGWQHASFGFRYMQGGGSRRSWEKVCQFAARKLIARKLASEGIRKPASARVTVKLELGDFHRLRGRVRTVQCVFPVFPVRSAERHHAVERAIFFFFFFFLGGIAARAQRQQV